MLRDGKKIRDKMYLYLKATYDKALAPSWGVERMMATAYTFREAEKHFNELKNSIELRKGIKILDAGCGFGHFVSYCLDRGYDYYGYEVDPRLAKISQEVLAKNKQDKERVKYVAGGKLPYKEKAFDLIYLHFVLDCVKDIPALLKELKRILKDDGQIFIIAPNYQCFYSPVYALIFIPWLPKFFNRLYFRIMGRPNTKFLESLNFITPGYVEKIFKTSGFTIDNLGLRFWEDLITGKKLTHRGNFLKAMVRYGKKFKLTWLLRLVSKLGFYTPMVYVLRKAVIDNDKKSIL